VIYQNRHECKFVVTEAVAAKVLRSVRPHVELDPYAACQPHHSYEVASLYLDDPFDSLYRETIEGSSERYKLRVRSYGSDAMHERRTVFLEVKRRYNSIVRKLRCPVPYELLEDLLNGANITRDEVLSALPDRYRPGLHEFLRLTAMRAAGPRCTVRYRREAYVGRDDLDTRVTFDRQLSTLPTESARVRHHDPCYIAVPTGGVILELKFTDRSPPWMAATIRKLELQRRSFSKYCSSIDAQRTAGNGRAGEASA
jgi:hypothetical protein